MKEAEQKVPTYQNAYTATGVRARKRGHRAWNDAAARESDGEMVAPDASSMKKRFVRPPGQWRGKLAGVENTPGVPHGNTSVRVATGKWSIPT